jgi:hypothetical protein
MGNELRDEGGRLIDAGLLPGAPIGEWRPEATEHEDTHVSDVYWVRGVPCGYVVDFGENSYPYIFNHRLGSYGSLETARKTVEELAAGPAKGLIDWIANRDARTRP